MLSIIADMMQIDNSILAEFDPVLANISNLLDIHKEEIYESIKLIDTSECTNCNSLQLSTIIRLAIFKSIRKVTYRELSTATRSDLALRSFCNIGNKFWINKSTLQDAISSIPQELLEKINQIIFSKYEDQSSVKIDSTAVEANVSVSENNSLLYNGLRRGNHIMDIIEKILDENIFNTYIDDKKGKQLSYNIRFAKNDSKEKLTAYEDLLFLCGDMQDNLPKIIDTAISAAHNETNPIKQRKLFKYIDELEFLGEKLSCTIYQSIAWLQGEKLKPSDKLFSMAGNMEHVDIIIKDNRKIVYGHKVDVVEGRKGLISHVIIHEGNPNDSTTLLNTIDLLQTVFGRTLDTVVTDGGYNSRSNLTALKEKGINEVVFTRKRALSLDDMGVSVERFNQLKNWRTGIERGIGRLKKRFGFDRVVCTSIERFKLYLWIGVLSANLALIGSKPKLFAMA